MIITRSNYIYFYNLDLGFKKGQFSRIILIIGTIWQKLNNDHHSGDILVAHLRLYKEKKILITNHMLKDMIHHYYGRILWNLNQLIYKI